jgi:hypothetical protein
VEFSDLTNAINTPFDNIFYFSGAGTYAKEDNGASIIWTKQSGTSSSSTPSERQSRPTERPQSRGQSGQQQTQQADPPPPPPAEDSGGRRRQR